MVPNISVVIPAYKAQAFIHRSVSSVLRQTRDDWEVVIASDDGTDYARLLRDGGFSDSRLRCVLTEGIGTGPANARNTGMDAARARFIATLDADDALDPEALEILVPLAHRHGAAYSRCLFIDHATGVELKSMDRLLRTGPVQLEDILTSQVHTYAGIVFDRSSVRARWPGWMQRWEDVYFYVSCFDDLESIYHVARPLYTYYRIEGSICNRPETSKEYLTWANQLLKRLEQGDPLALRTPSTRRLFMRFLLSRQTIEAAFILALAEGLCSDFHSFTQLRLDLFHSLEPESVPPPAKNILPGAS
ncbi:MAG: glycosyltransferase family 2 protein [Polyangiaceae bacterium]|nr:glycosyltransferase family 2 protein [Polyangiaceae bacterium]